MVGSIRRAICSPRKYPARNGLLDGGRNSLLKSAQEATFKSVAISGLQRQSKEMGIAP
jgi:hypothetical protein